MDRRRFLPTYHYEDNTGGLLKESVGKPLRDYKIYGNSEQNGTPSPEAPVEIMSVGEKTVNLFEGFDVAYCPSSTYSISENSVTFNPGSKIAYYAYISFYVNNVKLGYTYTISCDIDFDTASDAKPMLRFGYHRADGTFAYLKNKITATVGRHNLTFTLPAVMPEDIETSGRFVVLYNYTYVNATSISDLTLSNFQLEEGETETAYEPYGYKVPIKVIGKNLYDAETHFNAVYEAETMPSHKPSKGVVDGVECYQYWGRNFSLEYPENVLYIKDIFKENTQYTISLDRYDIFFSNGYPGVNVQVYYTDGTYQYASVSIIGEALEKTWRHDTFTTAVNKTIKHIYFGYSTGGAQTYFANMQIEEGTTETTYEPYKDLGTTNIYLAEPLRKAGDIADYIDFKNGKVVRALDCLTLDGTEKWLSTDKIVYMTWGTVDNYTYINGETLSTHLRNYATREDGEMYFEPVITVLRVYKMNGTYTDVEGWKTFLAEEYAKGNPVQLITPFATPKEEAIELLPIPTAKGIVNIMVDTDVQPSGAVWQYYRE